jgi:hypothetical protein
MPSVAELMKSLPEGEEPDHPDEAALPEALAALSMRPVPVGQMRRLRMLGTLQAKIAAAYLFYWVRGWFKNAAEKERLLAETHWRTALRLFDSMGYLRGAVMKVGQMLANFPDIAPQAFVETLDRLHFDAPPMHWSLLTEMVRGELGDEPEQVFASFEKRAFAAASLGQAHRATLKSGGRVVVKVQYPGIARTIREDLRNLTLFLLPGRLGKDWDNVKEQLDDLCARLAHETDYEREAATLAKVRPLFGEDEGIVVPRVYPQLTTARVLTMEQVEGVHLDQYLARDPSQAERDAAAEKLVRAWYRLMYAGRLVYLDFHPGNFLFLDDGRVGLLDFGMMLELDGELWNAFSIIDRALTTGKPEDLTAANRMWCDLPDEPSGSERMKLIDAYADWCWRARYRGGAFDFGDEADFRRGVDLFARMIARRYSRAKPCTPVIARSHFGWRSILYRLRARLDIRALAESEIKATGWDRSGYA